MGCFFVLESALKTARQNNPIDLYRGLSNVETAFKRLKSNLDARPRCANIKMNV